LDSFIYVLDGLSSLQQLSLAYCFTQATLGPHGKQQTLDKVDGLLNKLFSLNSLRALDLSKNRFYPESLAMLFTLLAKSKTLKALAMSSVDGFTDDAAKVFVEALASNDQLKQLNIAGNKLSPSSVTQILQAIARKGTIADLDMSKCNFDGRFKELAELISLNKQLRSLSIQKVAMNSIQGAVLI
jgi:Ran GTPase-activating protein (RanGAP) involved in mRNA processing and transport